VHVWKNFLKQYTIPTVENIAVAGSVTSFGLPLGSVVCLGVLLPIGLQIRKRRQGGKPVLLQYGLVVLLIAASLLLYPYLQVSIAKPGSIASRVSNDQAKVILHKCIPRL
jgi:hypothetical protein